MSSLEQLPISFANTLALHIKTFKIVGLDFFNDPNRRFENRCKFILFTTTIVTFFIFLALFYVNYYEVGGDFKDVANSLPILLLVMQALAKLTVIRKTHLTRWIILGIADMWPLDLDNEEKDKIMKSWLRRLELITKFFLALFNWTFYCALVFLWIPFVVYIIGRRADSSMQYLYPFVMYYPFEIDSMWKYLLTYAYQVICGLIIHICMYQACDLLVGTLLADICILMRLLQYDLEHLNVARKDVYGRRDPVEADRCYTEVKQIARTHQKLIRLTELVNDLYGGIVFTVVCFSSVILCFFGFLIIAFSTDHLQLFRNIMCLMEMLFIVFFISLPGQVLHDTSSGMADAAYNSQWYEGDLKFRKVIFIIIARSQKPCRFSALGFYDMNFNAFCKVCSSAWSYLSLVNQMYQEY